MEKDVIQIYPKTWKLLALAGIGLLFVAGGAWVVLTAAALPYSLVGAILLVAGLVVAVQQLSRYVREQRHPEARVVIAPRELRLWTQQGYLVIPWTDIVKLRQWTNGGEELILIDVRPSYEPNISADALSSLSLEETFAGRGYTIAPGTLKMGEHELKLLLNQYWQAATGK